MSKIRTVKPELYRHIKLFESEQAYELPLRLAFTGLFTCCDREGRFKWEARQLKLDILPYDEIDFEFVLNALWISGFIVKYTCNGKYYGYIPTWCDHQSINSREPNSKLPDPTTCTHVPFQAMVIHDAESSTQNQVTHVHAQATHEHVQETRVHAHLELEVEMEREMEVENIFMSGKPDVVSLAHENNFVNPDNASPQQPSTSLKTQALEVLQFLNEKTERAYRPVDTNLKLIMARLKSGANVMDCRQVIAKKTREWKSDPKMTEYLRPATLFNATKFEQYFGELLPDDDDDE